MQERAKVADVKRLLLGSGFGFPPYSSFYFFLFFNPAMLVAVESGDPKELADQAGSWFQREHGGGWKCVDLIALRLLCRQ